MDHAHKGFVKLVRKDSQQATLAYQDATSPDPMIYLLSKENFGAILPLRQVLLNFEVGRLDIDLTSEVFEMHSWRQVAPPVLAAVAPAFNEPQPPTAEEWRRITQGHSLQFCPTVTCKTCSIVRYVAPIAYAELTFPLSCPQVGLCCNSFRQDFPVIAFQKLPSTTQGVPGQDNPSPCAPLEAMPQTPSSASAFPASTPPGGHHSTPSHTRTKSWATEPLKPQEAFIRGNLSQVRPTRATPQDLLQYTELIKLNPGTFGLRALMKIATSDTAPKFAAPPEYQAFVSWKTSWESLFATHIVDNPKIQVQIATLSLQGEARDWWNTYWADNPHQDITWTWFTDLVRATFYPLEAQENAFTAWSELEYKDDVPIFFEKVRKNLRRYPIPLTHLISILSFQLGKAFAVRIKSRMAMTREAEITLYELQAIAEELFLNEKEKEAHTRKKPIDRDLLNHSPNKDPLRSPRSPRQIRPLPTKKGK